MTVNTKALISTRSQILDMLRNATVPVSGESAATKIGVSRVSVWKGIQALNAGGYHISSSSGGYRLEADLDDSIYPWEFGEAEDRFRHWKEIDSTMNPAREAALTGSASGLVITAESQSAGRGTGTKKWESAAGGLFFTLLTRPSLNVAYAHRQVLAAQLALARAICTVTGTNAMPLWPNDLLFDGGKAGGILAEYLASGGMVHWLNLGIGLNIGKPPSISGTSAIPALRKNILREFLTEFEKIETQEYTLAAGWNKSCPLTGKSVRFQKLSPTGLPGALKSGTFRGVDEAGWALIETFNDKYLPEESRFPPNTIIILDKGYET